MLLAPQLLPLSDPPWSEMQFCGLPQRTYSGIWRLRGSSQPFRIVYLYVRCFKASYVNWGQGTIPERFVLVFHIWEIHTNIFYLDVTCFPCCIPKRAEMGITVKVTESLIFKRLWHFPDDFTPCSRGRPSHECHWVCGDWPWSHWAICQTHVGHLKQLQQSNVSVIRHFSTTEKYTNGKSFICSEIMILRVQLTAKQHNTWLWNSDLSRSGFGSADSHWDAYHAEQKTIPHSTPPPPHTHLKDISTSAPPPYSCCILFGISELIMTSARHGKLDLSWYAKANAKQTSHRHTWARLSPIISL